MKEAIIALIYGIAEREDTERQEAMRDLLTDIRHAADHLGLDFDDAVVGSGEVFENEVEEAKAN